jgi:hypothetical protein
MGIGKDKLGNTYSVTYHDGTGNIKGATYTTITTQGHLNLIDSGVTPTSPSTGKITIFAEEYAGRVLPSAIGPSGVDYVLQAALYGNTNYVWLAGVAATPAVTWGTAWTALNSGTGTIQSHPIKASTNAMTSLNRANFSTGSTLTGVSGVRSASTTAWLGNAAGLGGFLFFARFGVETVSGTYRALVGLSTNTGTLAATPAEPSNALIHSIYLAKDTLDSTWHAVTRGSSTGGVNGTNFNKINTGIPVATGQILDLYIHSAPNSQSVKFYIKDGSTGADLYVGGVLGTASTLPGNTQFLYSQIQIASSSGTTPKLMALNLMYLESDL